MCSLRLARLFCGLRELKTNAKGQRSPTGFRLLKLVRGQGFVFGFCRAMLLRRLSALSSPSAPPAAASWRQPTPPGCGLTGRDTKPATLCLSTCRVHYYKHGDCRDECCYKMTSPNKKIAWSDLRALGVPGAVDRSSSSYCCTTATAAVNFQGQDALLPAGGVSLPSPRSVQRSGSMHDQDFYSGAAGTVCSTKLHRQARSGFYCHPQATGTAARKGQGGSGPGARKKLGTGSQGRRAAVPAVLRKSGPQ